jgi:protein TonB
MNFGMPDKQDTDDHLLDELLKNVDQAPAADKVEKVRAVKIPKKIDFDAVPKKTPPTVAPNPTLDKVVVSDNQQYEHPDDERPVDEKKKPEEKINPPVDPIPLEQLNQGERTVSDTPVPPGGWADFAMWVDKNLQYPGQARQKKIEGNVLAAFNVNPDGTVSDLHVVGKADPILSAEVLRLLKTMGKWKPGIENDVPCKTYVELPFLFKL